MNEVARESRSVGVRLILRPACTRKLFCHCPIAAPTADFVLQIQRTFREAPAPAMDVAAHGGAHRAVYYRVHTTSTCTYELDDCAPFDLSAEAVRMVLDAASCLGAEPVAEAVVMRREVADGRYPAGFQRTVCIARGGALVVGDTRLPVRELALEEAPARLALDDPTTHHCYLTDALGIPEIAVTLDPLESGSLSDRLGTLRQGLDTRLGALHRMELSAWGHVLELSALEHLGSWRQLLQRTLALPHGAILRAPCPPLRVDTDLRPIDLRADRAPRSR